MPGSDVAMSDVPVNGNAEAGGPLVSPYDGYKHWQRIRVVSRNALDDEILKETVRSLVSSYGRRRGLMQRWRLNRLTIEMQCTASWRQRDSSII